MKRRTFLSATAALGLGLFVPLNALSQTPRVRRDIRKVVKDPVQLKALRDGFKALRDNKDLIDHAISWRFQAAVHGHPPLPKSCSIPEWLETLVDRPRLRLASDQTKQFFAQCDHGVDHADGFAPHFLSWHRMYLFYFEEVIRHLTSNPDFALPYWDTVADSRLPEEFWADKTAANSLYLSERGTNTNKGLQVVCVGAANDNAVRDSATLHALTIGLESNPHGIIHDNFGGAMHAAEYAALDPMFWLHHANIDRLWWEWQSMSTHGVKPDSSEDHDWVSRSFTFLTIHGPKTAPVSHFLDISTIAAGGAYIYERPVVGEGGTPCPAPLPDKPQVTASGEPVMTPFGNQAFVLSVTKTPIALTQRSSTLRLPMTTAGGTKIQSLDSGKKPSGQITSAILVLRSVRLTEAGSREGFSYDVYVNLPDKPGSSSNQSALKVASFGPWTLTSSDDALCVPGGGVNLRFSIIAQLAATIKTTGTGAVDISFVRTGAVDSEGKTVPLPTDMPLVEIQSAWIEASNAPTE